MKIGVAMFFTDYSMTPAEIASAAEERGFDSFWAPEHCHIPLSRSRLPRAAASCRSSTTT